MSSNTNLYKARINKNDEFYTLLEDIKKECDHYINQFEDKIIYLNCDNPEFSNFWKYFSENFENFKLKKLISTHYEKEKQTYKMEIFKDNNEICTTINKLSGNGDFRSDESIELLKEADIVVTNPPFSLFREYIAQLMQYDKQFIIIGNINAITYKEVFPLLKDNKIWIGCTNFNLGMYFYVPEDFKYTEAYKGKKEIDGKKVNRVPGCCWYTNIDITKRHEDIVLYRTYNEDDYPKYDNYDAINVDKVSEIPMDYDGVMGVPITFMDKYNPEQFVIVGQTHSGDTSPEVEVIRTDPEHRHGGRINGKKKFARIFIKVKEE
jgi:hypothetical protein